MTITEDVYEQKREAAKVYKHLVERAEGNKVGMGKLKDAANVSTYVARTVIKEIKEYGQVIRPTLLTKMKKLKLPREEVMKMIQQDDEINAAKPPQQLLAERQAVETTKRELEACVTKKGRARVISKHRRRNNKAESKAAATKRNQQDQESQMEHKKAHHHHHQLLHHHHHHQQQQEGGTTTAMAVVNVLPPAGTQHQQGSSSMPPRLEDGTSFSPKEGALPRVVDTAWACTDCNYVNLNLDGRAKFCCECGAKRARRNEEGAVEEPANCTTGTTASLAYLPQARNDATSTVPRVSREMGLNQTPDPSSHTAANDSESATNASRSTVASARDSSERKDDGALTVTVVANVFPPATVATPAPESETEGSELSTGLNRHQDPSTNHIAPPVQLERQGLAPPQDRNDNIEHEESFVASMDDGQEEKEATSAAIDADADDDPTTTTKTAATPTPQDAVATNMHQTAQNIQKKIPDGPGICPVEHKANHPNQQQEGCITTTTMQPAAKRVATSMLPRHEDGAADSETEGTAGSTGLNQHQDPSTNDVAPPVQPQQENRGGESNETNPKNQDNEAPSLSTSPAGSRHLATDSESATKARDNREQQDDHMDMETIPVAAAGTVAPEPGDEDYDDQCRSFPAELQVDEAAVAVPPAESRKHKMEGDSMCNTGLSQPQGHQRIQDPSTNNPAPKDDDDDDGFIIGTLMDEEGREQDVDDAVAVETEGSHDDAPATPPGVGVGAGSTAVDASASANVFSPTTAVANVLPPAAAVMHVLPPVAVPPAESSPCRNATRSATRKRAAGPGRYATRSTTRKVAADPVRYATRYGARKRKGAPCRKASRARKRVRGGRTAGTVAPEDATVVPLQESSPTIRTFHIGNLLFAIFEYVGADQARFMLHVSKAFNNNYKTYLANESYKKYMELPTVPYWCAAKAPKVDYDSYKKYVETQPLVIGSASIAEIPKDSENIGSDKRFKIYLDGLKSKKSNDREIEFIKYVTAQAEINGNKALLTAVRQEYPHLKHMDKQHFHQYVNHVVAKAAISGNEIFLAMAVKKYDHLRSVKLPMTPLAEQDQLLCEVVARLGHLKCLQSLISCRCQTGQASTPVWYAALQGGHLEVIKWVMNADILSEGKGDTNALSHYAACPESWKIAISSQNTTVDLLDYLWEETPEETKDIVQNVCTNSGATLRKDLKSWYNKTIRKWSRERKEGKKQKVRSL